MNNPHESLIRRMYKHPNIPSHFQCDGCSSSKDWYFYIPCKIHDWWYNSLRHLDHIIFILEVFPMDEVGIEMQKNNWKTGRKKADLELRSNISAGAFKVEWDFKKQRYVIKKKHMHFFRKYFAITRYYAVSMFGGKAAKFNKGAMR